MTKEIELPQWERYAVVRADEVERIDSASASRMDATGIPRPRAVNDTGKRVVLKCGRIVYVTTEMTERRFPEIGDYYVVNSDGTEGFVQAKDFLRAHRRPSRAA